MLYLHMEKKWKATTKTDDDLVYGHWPRTVFLFPWKERRVTVAERTDKGLEELATCEGYLPRMPEKVWAWWSRNGVDAR